MSKLSLTEAAHALERELARFEELTTAAGEIPLDTHKSIETAGRAVTAAALEQDRVDAALGTLVTVIAAARTRHEENMASLQDRGDEIRLRADEFAVLHARYRVFGEESTEIGELLTELLAKVDAVSSREGILELGAAIEEIEQRMTTLAEGARDLGDVAIAASMTDLAEQAGALHRQAASARDKIVLLRESLLMRLPDPLKPN